MSDQREIHIDIDRLRDFVLGDDRETRLHALKAVYGILEVHSGNGPQVQAKIMVALNARLPELKERLLSSEVFEQRVLVGILGRMVDIAGSDALDLSTEALEVALETDHFFLKKEAQALLHKYMDAGVNRRGIMRALVGGAALDLCWGNASVFRSVATSALEYPELREASLVVLAGVASHPTVQLNERKRALLTIETLLLKGMDISCIERGLRMLSKQRDCPLMEDVRALLREANMRDFNRPGKPGIFAKLGVAMHAIAPVQLRRTGTSA